MVSFLCRDDWSIRGKHEVDSGIWNKIGLELSDINIQSSVESKRSSQRRNDLCNKSVQVGVSRSLDVEVSSRDIIDGLVVKHDSNISVFKEGMS